jgi:hypothetical protein
METNKFMPWIAVVLLSGAFCAITAVAEVATPSPYQRMTAVDLNPSQAPMLNYGVQKLSSNEAHYRENLPLQLKGAIYRVERRKPTNPRRH